MSRASLAEHSAASERLAGAPGTASILSPGLADLFGTFRARDGSEVAWRTVDGSPPCIRIAVAPVRPGHSVTLDILRDGIVTELAAAPEWGAPASGERIYKALLPQPLAGVVELLPVLRFAGQPVSPRRAASPASSPASAAAAAPLWDWAARFLFSLTAKVRRQDVGDGPDGLRIDWLIEDGRFAGPRMEGVVLPGAVDFMRVRRDGVAIVDVRASLETGDGARLYVAYGGALDLGPDGYARALRGHFPALPPLTVTPTFETPDARLQWLNRVRCFGVGRVDPQALSYGFDVYALEVGQRTGLQQRT